MIVVKVELHSAITGDVTELGRMHIANDGQRTLEDRTRGTYDGKTLVKGRPHQAARTGKVVDYPRDALSVWCLVRRMLEAMLYK